MPITATGQLARGRAGVEIRGVTVITSFDAFVDRSIAAASRFTSVSARVSVDVVTVVTLLFFVDFTVTAAL